MVVDLSKYPTNIDLSREEVEDWFRPVFERGRAAVFVDTGFLRALIFQGDQYSYVAEEQFEGAVHTNAYTTTLVLAELVRQLAKDKKSREFERDSMFEKFSDLVFESGRFVVCSPPVALARQAYEELLCPGRRIVGLDLCDAVSMKVLEYARHRRVFGFDRRHFQEAGALVEP